MRTQDGDYQNTAILGQAESPVWIGGFEAHEPVCSGSARNFARLAFRHDGIECELGFTARLLI